MTEEMDRLMTIVEVAAKLGISYQRVQKCIKDGLLSSETFGREVRIRESEYRRFRRERRRRGHGKPIPTALPKVTA